MGRFERANLILGGGVLIAALAIGLIWVPIDSATGLVEKVRRQVTIGDALAPTIAAGFLFLGGVLVAFFSPEGTARRLTPRNIRFLLIFLGILVASFAVMRWLGPAIAGLMTDGGYRVLRDTVPWKYLGFVVGGTGLIAALIGLVEERVSLRGVLIGLAATIGLIVVYDLPFDDLLLPPNGDV